MQEQLYSEDSAAMLVPGYMVTRQRDGIQVELKDLHKRMVSLSDLLGRNWVEELHLLCLANNEQYSSLWTE